MVIQSKLRDVEFPAYYFDLSYEEYTAIKNENRRVRLTINFVDVVARKYGDLEFNGRLYYFDTKEVSFTMDLSRDVVHGANAIKIKPKKTLDVVEEDYEEIEVEVEDDEEIEIEDIDIDD